MKTLTVVTKSTDNNTENFLSSHYSTQVLIAISSMDKKIRQSLYRSGQALRFHEVEVPRFQDGT